MNHAKSQTPSLALLKKEIDEVIKKYGDWPGTFQKFKESRKDGK